MRCAVINASDWSILNVVMAGVGDTPVDGTFFIQITDDVPVDTTFKLAGGIGFISQEKQKFYDNALPGVALAAPVDDARALVSADLDATAAELKAAAKADATYSAAVDKRKTELAAQVAALTFDECVDFKPVWPAVPK